MGGAAEVRKASGKVRSAAREVQGRYRGKGKVETDRIESEKGRK